MKNKKKNFLDRLASAGVGISEVDKSLKSKKESTIDLTDESLFEIEHKKDE